MWLEHQVAYGQGVNKSEERLIKLINVYEYTKRTRAMQERGGRGGMSIPCIFYKLRAEHTGHVFRQVEQKQTGEQATLTCTWPVQYDLWGL